MKKRGFTLIELLAVIVILAVIALIATPLIMSVINDSKKSAFRNSIYHIVEIGEVEMASSSLKGDAPITTFDLSKDTLKYKGTKLTAGTLIFDQKGNYKIEATDGVWCAKKDFSATDITVTKKEDDCSGLVLEEGDIDIRIIVDNCAGSFLKDVKVVLTYPDGKQFEKLTDNSGIATFKGYNKTAYTVDLSKDGYYKRTQKISFDSSDKVVESKLCIEESILPPTPPTP